MKISENRSEKEDYKIKISTDRHAGTMADMGDHVPMSAAE